MAAAIDEEESPRPKKSKANPPPAEETEEPTPRRVVPEQQPTAPADPESTAKIVETAQNAFATPRLPVRTRATAATKTPTAGR